MQRWTAKTRQLALRAVQHRDHNAPMKFLSGKNRKRVALTAVSLAVIATVSAYFYATRPSRLRSALAAALENFESLRLANASLSFSLMNGLELRDVRVVLGRDSPLFDVLHEPAAREVLRVAHAQVRLKRAALLLGRIVPVEIRVDDAVINIVRDRDSGLLNLSLRQDVTGSAETFPRLPRIRLSNATLRLSTINQGGSRVLDQLQLDARGERVGDEFVLNIVKPGGKQESLGALRWNRKTGQLVADLAWTRLDTILGLLPGAYAGMEEQLQLTGRARLTSGLVIDGAFVGATVEFEQVKAGLPLGDAGWELPPSRRFLQVGEANGKLRISDEQVTVNAAASVNGAPVDLSVVATLDRDHPSRSAFKMAVKVDHLSLPWINDQNHAALFKDLPQRLTDFFEHYQPRIAISAEMTLSREAGAAQALAAEGWVDFHDGDSRYYRFPYQFHHAHGRVRFGADGITLEDIQAAHGSTRVTVNGKIAHSRRWTAFDLDIDAVNVPLDEDLYAAIPPEYRRTWDEVAPLGLSDVRVRLHRDEGSPEQGPRETTTRIEASLFGVSLDVGQGRRMTHVDGRVAIADRLTTIHDLRGFLDGADLRISGTIRGAASDRSGSTSLTAFASNVAIDRVTGQDDGPTFRVNGIADVWGRLRRSEDVADNDHYIVHMRSGSILSEDGATPWRISDAWFNQRRGRLEIVELAAHQDRDRSPRPAWLTVSGVIPTAGGGGEALRLSITAGDLQMENLGDLAPPGHWKDAIRQLGLAGTGRVSIQIASGSDPQAGDPTTAEVHIQADRFKPPSLPIDFENMQAHLVVFPDHCELRRASADYGETGTIRAGGRVGWGDDRRWSEFTISADDIHVDDALVAALPAKLRSFVERINLNGKAELRLDQLSYNSDDGGSWGFGGRLRVAGGSLNIGLPLSECFGEISASGRFGPGDRLRFEAEFTVDGGNIAGRAVQRCRGTISRTIDDSRLQLNLLQADWAGGQVSGSAEIDPASAAYDARLTLHNVSFEQLLRGAGPPAETPRAGWIDGHLFVRGTMGEPAARMGGGELAIRGAALLGTPIVRKIILKWKANGQPANGPIDLAELNFRLDGDVVHLVKADIQSRILRLVGEGRWNMGDDTIDLRLVGAHPKHWARVPVLSDLVEMIGREFVQYHVTGQAKSPRVTVEPLPNVTDMLRRLLKPLSKSSP